MYKYGKRVFAMDESELRAALGLLLANDNGNGNGWAAGVSREEMQEELVQWLLSEGLSPRHEFLFLREDDSPGQSQSEQVWLLARRTKDCPCCRTVGPAPASAPATKVSAAISSRQRSPSPAVRTNDGSCPVPAPAKPPRRPSPIPHSHYRHHQQLQQQQQLHCPSRPLYLPRGHRIDPIDLERGGSEMAESSREVITVQPLADGGERQKRDKKEDTKGKKKSKMGDCCAECGHFCVDLLSTLKY